MIFGLYYHTRLQFLRKSVTVAGLAVCPYLTPAQITFWRRRTSHNRERGVGTDVKLSAHLDKVLADKLNTAGCVRRVLWVVVLHCVAIGMVYKDLENLVRNCFSFLVRAATFIANAERDR